MATPVIIMGAGASHDYIRPDNRAVTNMHKDIFKPPLANGLCDPDMLTYIVKNPTQETRLISAYLRSQISEKKSLETCLGEFRDRAKTYKDGQKQLNSFQFYLAELFARISVEYRMPLNNYETLRVRIEQYLFDAKENNACIASFNYDTLLEGALEIDRHLPSYIKNPIKLIKLHGSCDWRFILGKSVYIRGDSYRYLMEDDPYHFAKQEVEKHILSERTTSYELKRETDTVYLSPAIALPLPGKRDTEYVCPPEHFEELKKALAETDRILIIGWSATDSHFIKTIRENIRRVINVMVVAGSQEKSLSVQEKLKDIKELKFEVVPFGFSDFLRSELCDRFFTQ